MKILHLYHDIMNLYGEYGNVRAMSRMMEKNGIEVQVDKLSLQDQPDFSEYDFIYVGAGTERDQKYVLQHLILYKDGLKEYIEKDGLLLMTGNSFEMLGTSLFDAGGQEHSGLGLFPFVVQEQDRVRTTADVILNMEGLAEPVVGFVNKCSQVKGITTPLFLVERGLGNEGKGGGEGIRSRNFFGTYVTGPVLVKNPAFLIYLTRCLIEKKWSREPSFMEGKYPDDSWMVREKAGYKVTLEKLRREGS